MLRHACGFRAGVACGLLIAFLTLHGWDGAGGFVPPWRGQGELSRIELIGAGVWSCCMDCMACHFEEGSLRAQSSHWCCCLCVPRMQVDKCSRILQVKGKVA